LRRVPVTAIRAGMCLAKSVALGDGRLFLKEGTVLRESYIDPLQQQGVVSVYVVNELAPDVVPVDVVTDQTRRTLTEETRAVVGQLQAHFTGETGRGLARFSVGLDATKLKEAVDRVVKELLTDRNVVFSLQDIRMADDYTLSHSVSVCILSTLVGTVLGLSTEELHDLAMGALLHDIGKVIVPQAILCKPDRLTPDEVAVMNQHTTAGWNILKELSSIPCTSAIVALQHHERWMGGGYPEGLQGKRIYLYSRICAIADCFDAMTADRVYRSGMPPARAMDVLLHEMQSYFQPELLWSFSQCVAPYPIGAMVALSTGEQAVVLGVTRGYTYQPRVRVVLNAAGERLAEPVEVDLRLSHDVRIMDLVCEGEIDVDDLDRVG